MEKMILSVLAALMLTANPAQAAFVTLNEDRMDAIFSQPSFGNNPIDIRFAPVRELVAPDRLDLTSNQEVFDLFSRHFGAQDTSNVFFVDTIGSCGPVGLVASLAPVDLRLIGCGEFPGNDVAVESRFAGGPFGAELLAHELGHNLGLAHLADPENLMNAVLEGGTELLASQVSTILGSPLVQGEDNLFIDVIPVLVVAEEVAVPVPLPGTALLFALGLVIMQLKRRRG